LTKQQIWELTLPQLSYLLKQCHEHIEFTVKVSSMGLAMFGGGMVEESSSGVEHRPDGEYIDGYKVADEEDMQFLAQLLGG
jgi:hypothetical protein